MVLTLHIRHLTGESLPQLVPPLGRTGNATATSSVWSVLKKSMLQLSSVKSSFSRWKLCFVLFFWSQSPSLISQVLPTSLPIQYQAISLSLGKHTQINTERTKKHEKHVQMHYSYIWEDSFSYFYLPLKLAAFLLSHKWQVTHFLHMWRNSALERRLLAQGHTSL